MDGGWHAERVWAFCLRLGAGSRAMEGSPDALGEATEAEEWMNVVGSWDDQRSVAAKVDVEVNAPFQHLGGEWPARFLGWVQREESHLVLAVVENRPVAVTNADRGQIVGVDGSYRWMMLVDA